ncbi:MAG: hypothetical protein WC595_02270 [Candidatus Nanoarchaeia archaeon]
MKRSRPLEVLLALAVTVSGCKKESLISPQIPSEEIGDNPLNRAVGLSGGSQTSTLTSVLDAGISEADSGVEHADSGSLDGSVSGVDAEERRDGSIPEVAYEAALRVPLASDKKYHLTANGFVTARGKKGYAVVSPANGLVITSSERIVGVDYGFEGDQNFLPLPYAEREIRLSSLEEATKEQSVSERRGDVLVIGETVSIPYLVRVRLQRGERGYANYQTTVEWLYVYVSSHPFNDAKVQIEGQVHPKVAVPESTPFSSFLK